MFHRRYQYVALFASLAVASGCSGGGGSTSRYTPSNPSGGQSSSSGKVVQATLTLVIPRPAAAKASATRSASAGLRHLQYVSAATQGVGIVATSGGATIDSKAYATSAATNSACSNGANAVKCVFTIGALAPQTTYTITAYDAAPTTQGGAATAFPSTANPLSTTSATVAITAGANNPISLSLGGVPASIAFPTSLVPAGQNAPVMSVPGQGAPSTLQFTPVVTDADGDTITTGASSPYAVPIVVSIDEPSTLTGFTTLSLNGGAPSTSVNVTQATDVVTLSYTGAAPNADVALDDYYAVVSMASTFTDATTGATEAPTSVAFTLAPLFVVGNTNGVSGVTFADGSAKTLPGLTFAQQPNASGANPTLEVTAALASTANGAGTVGAAPVGSCPAFSLGQPTNNAASGDVDTIYPALLNNGASSGNCQFTFGDGSGVTQVAGLNYQPTSGTGQTFSPPNNSTFNLTANDTFVSLGVTDYSDPGSAITLVNTDCSASSNATCSSSSGGSPSCSNASGLMGAAQQSDGTIDLEFTAGDYAVYGSSGTGPFSCTFTLTDSASTTFTYTMNAVFDGSGTVSGRRRFGKARATLTNHRSTRSHV